MKRMCMIVCLVVLCSSVNCMRTYSVKTKTESLHGLPFYVKRLACSHSTSYLEPIYDVVFEREIVIRDTTGKALEKSTSELNRLSISHDTYNTSQTIRDLRQYFSAGKDINPDKVDVELSKLPKHSANDVFNTKNQFLIENSTTPSLYIDYETTHYVNFKRPWFGTTKTDIAYRDDGTLSSVKAEVEDKTGEKVMDLLPIKEVLSAQFVPKGAEKDQLGVRAPNTAEVQLVLRIEATVLKHTLAKVEQLPKKNTGICDPVGFINLTEENTKTYNYTSIKLPDASPAKKEKDKKRIGIEGEITLPENGDAK
jgi:hypothetical protein